MTHPRTYGNLCVVLICIIVLLSVLLYHYSSGYESARIDNARLSQESKRHADKAEPYIATADSLAKTRDTIKAQRAALQKREAELRRYKYEKPASLPVNVTDMQLYWERFRTDNRP